MTDRELERVHALEKIVARELALHRQERAAQAWKDGTITAEHAHEYFPERIARAFAIAATGSSEVRLVRLRGAQRIPADPEPDSMKALFELGSYLPSEPAPSELQDIVRARIQEPPGSPARAYTNVMLIAIGGMDALRLRRHVEQVFLSWCVHTGHLDVVGDLDAEKLFHSRDNLEPLREVDLAAVADRLLGWAQQVRAAWLEDKILIVDADDAPEFIAATQICRYFPDETVPPQHSELLERAANQHPGSLAQLRASTYLAAMEGTDGLAIRQRLEDGFTDYYLEERRRDSVTIGAAVYKSGCDAPLAYWRPDLLPPECYDKAAASLCRCHDIPALSPLRGFSDKNPELSILAEVATWLEDRTRYLNGGCAGDEVAPLCYPTSDHIVESCIRVLRRYDDELKHHR